MDLSLAHRSRWHWLTLNRLVTIIVFIAIFAMAARFPLDTDSWWHLQSGRWIVEHRAVPGSDPFSHTRFGQPWIDHGWLAQAILYLVYAGAGYGGLVLALAALVTAAFFFSWLQCPQGDCWLRAFVFVVAAVASGIIWAVRPQMVSFVLAAIVAYLLYLYKQGATRAIWWLPLVVLVWVNIHGGFAIAFILIAAYLFGEVGNQIGRLGTENTDVARPLGWRGIGHLLLVTVVCILVLPLNPNGFQMWAYPFRTVGIDVLQDFIVEWQSPNFHAFYLHPFIWLLLAALTAFGLAGRRADFTDLTLVALFAYLSLLAVRNIPLFALVTAPIIVRYGTLALRQWRGTREIKQTSFVALNWLLLLLVLGAALAYVMQTAQAAEEEAAQPEGLPAGAVAYLQEEQPPGPIYNDYNWGGYLIWRLPRYPVFVDGRTDLYDDAFLRQYLSIYTAEEGWERKLREQGINLVLIAAQSPLARALDAQPGWHLAYEDSVAVVYTRR